MSMLPRESQEILTGYLPVRLQRQLEPEAISSENSSSVDHQLLCDFRDDLIRCQLNESNDTGILRLTPVEFYEALKDETPQTISALLLSASRKKASELLCAFPLNQRVALVRAMICRNQPDESILNDIEDELRRRVSTQPQNEKSSDQNDGAEFLREVIRHCEPALVAKLRSTIERADVQFAQDLEPTKEAG